MVKRLLNEKFILVGLGLFSIIAISLAVGIYVQINKTERTPKVLGDSNSATWGDISTNTYVGTNQNTSPYHAVSDGAGGTIFMWEDSGIKGKVLDGSGAEVCTFSNPNEFHMLVSDGSGGAAVLINDENEVIYYGGCASGFSSTLTLFPANPSRTYSPVYLIEDGTGNFIFSGSISDYSGIPTSTGYAQKFTPSLTLQWGNDGVSYDMNREGSSGMGYNKPISDGQGGIIIPWHVTDVAKLYIHRIDSSQSFPFGPTGKLFPNDIHVGGMLISDVNSFWVSLRGGTAGTRIAKLSLTDASEILSIPNTLNASYPYVSDNAGGFFTIGPTNSSTLSRYSSNGTLLWTQYTGAPVYNAGYNLTSTALTIFGGRNLQCTTSINNGLGFQRLRISDGAILNNQQCVTNNHPYTSNTQIIDAGNDLDTIFVWSEPGSAPYDIYADKTDFVEFQIAANQDDFNVFKDSDPGATYNLDSINIAPAINGRFNETVNLNSSTSPSELVYLYSTDSNYYMLNVTTDMTEDRVWHDPYIDYSLTAAQSNNGKRTFIGNILLREGVTSPSALTYVVKDPSDTVLRLCPDATDIYSVNLRCDNGINLDFSAPNVSTTTIEGQEYWAVSGINSGGIASYGDVGENLFWSGTTNAVSGSDKHQDLQLIDIETEELIDYRYLTSSDPTLSISGISGLDYNPITCDVFSSVVFLDSGTGFNNGQIGQIDLNTGSVTRLSLENYYFNDIAFSTDGRMFAIMNYYQGYLKGETLYEIDTDTYAATELIEFATSDNGEAIAFNPDDGLLYHFSGGEVAGDTILFEKIDINTLARTSITANNNGLFVGEPRAFYYMGNDEFVFTDWSYNFFKINTAGEISELLPYTNTPSNALIPEKCNPLAQTLSLVSSQTNVQTDEQFDIQIKALDINGLETPNYNGEIEFSSTGNSDLPEDYTFLESDLGAKEFTELSFTETGTFTITATDTSDGTISGTSNTITVTEEEEVIVEPNLVSTNFSASPIMGYDSLTVAFKDLSTGSPYAWEWDFGDDQVSSAQNPNHVYAKPGIYTVTLKATNAYGSNTNAKEGFITVYDSASCEPLDGDPDEDGLTNEEELTAGTACDNADSDSDGLSDFVEINTNKTDPLNPDTDNDGLSDGDEVNIYKTDPNKADTDGDDKLDGEEIDGCIYTRVGDEVVKDCETETEVTDPLVPDFKTEFTQSEVDVSEESIINSAIEAFKGVADTEAPTALAIVAAVTVGSTIASSPGILLYAVVIFRRKKKSPWGIIYSDKNKPVAFATIRLYDNKTGLLIDQDITNLNGKYGLNAEAGSYNLEITHADFETYKSVVQLTSNNQYITEDIKLVSNNSKLSGIRNSIRSIFANFGEALFYAGILTSLVITFLSPNIFNFIILGVYIVQIVLIRLNKPNKGWGSVYFEDVNENVSGAFVRLLNSETGQIEDVQMTDKNGRYGFKKDITENYLLSINGPTLSFPAKNDTSHKIVTNAVDSKLISLEANTDLNIPVDRK